MNSKEYWAKREEEALRHYIKDEKEYDKQIEQIYRSMMDSIQSEINAFYGRYASKEGITLAEAKKRVTQLDIAAYERKAERYVKEKEFSQKANEEMRLYNATMRINRLEMLKANIGLHLVEGYDELERLMGDVLEDRTMEELERQAGILGKTIRSNDKKAHAIPNASFHNATFSDRVWTNQALLRNELNNLLQSGLIQGKNPRVLARDIKKKFGTSTYSAERLMRTELARVQTAAQKQSFERNGFKYYEFIANSGCCDACQSLNGKHFPVSKMMPGENAAPIHPHCRCSVAPWEDSAEYEAWLNYLASGGTTEQWEKWNRAKNAAESGSYQTGVKRISTNDVDPEYVKSAEFRKKFSRITDNTAVNAAIRKYAEAMLTHRNGTDGEDLYIIDSLTGKLLLRKIGENKELGVTVTAEEVRELRKNNFGRMIGIHNHPTNVPPTGSDYSTAGYRGYDFGVVVTHSGRLYKYESGSMPFLPELFDKRVDKYIDKPYDMKLEEAHEKVLNEFVKEYGISWQEIK